mgnify:CR=1 FL=1
MKITLRGKNIEITEAIEEKVGEKLSKLDKYFIVSENVEAKVLVRTYPYGQKIEVTIPTEYVLLRAEVVDQDLYNAIVSGQIAGAGMDTLFPEPVPFDHPLLQLPEHLQYKVTLSPHIGGTTYGVFRHMYRTIWSNISAVCHEKKPNHIVV